MNSPSSHPAFPNALPDIKVPPSEAIEMIARYQGLTKRELFSLVLLHAEFHSCGSNEDSAAALYQAASKAGQSVERRMCINAITLADELLAELAKEKKA